MVSALCGFTAVESNHSLCCHHCVTRHSGAVQSWRFQDGTVSLFVLARST